MKVFVMIPTYNEATNIRRLVPMIFREVPQVDVLVVDDDSPDKTAEEVKKLAKKYPRKVHLLLRKKARGRGSAGIDGFKYVLKKGADAVVEMDADFSHHPRHLPKMLKEIETYDVVTGSRFIQGGEDKRSFLRHTITLLGNFYVRTALGLRLKDPLTGYRVFRRKVLEKINLDALVSYNWAVVQEMLYKADLLGFSIKEVPISFVNRQRGDSKFNFKVMLQSILMVLVMKFIFTDVWKENHTRND